MYILVGSNSVIQGYSSKEIVGGIKVDENSAEFIKQNYEPKRLLYKNDSVIIDPHYSGLTQVMEAINYKCSEIARKCEETILNGVDVTYDNFTRHYSLTHADQLNMITLYGIASQGIDVAYHADNEICRSYTPKEFINLYITSFSFILSESTYCNCLKKQVAAMTNLEDILEVTYHATNLVGDYKVAYNSVISQCSDNLSKINLLSC